MRSGSDGRDSQPGPTAIIGCHLDELSQDRNFSHDHVLPAGR
jgi:hypothetical protein